MEEKYKTRVVFKMAKPEEGQYSSKNDCVAFLLDCPTSAGIHIMSYMHVGQHSEAYAGFYYDCWTCTPDEYADLKEELESIGYELTVLKKCNAWEVAIKNWRNRQNN